MQYIFTSKTNKGKSSRVSLISHVYSQEIRFTLVCVFWCLQKVSSKITFLQPIFAAFLVVLGPFWLYEEFDDRYPKKPLSVTKKDVRYHIHHLYRPIILRLIRVWLQKLIENDHSDQNENSMTTPLFCWNYQTLKISVSQKK